MLSLWQRVPSRYGGVSITSGENLRVALASDLHSSVDGRGLRESDLVPHQHQWVADAANLLSGANYIGAVKVRGNLLPSAVCAARGRPAISVLCGACQRPGSLGHILQVCPRTHGSRIARHDRVVTWCSLLRVKPGGLVSESLHTNYSRPAEAGPHIPSQREVHLSP